MDYVDAPDVSAAADDAWKNPGDPANAYVPDLSSPGPGKTDPSDKSSDPQIKASDVKPNYVIGGPKTGTRSPAEYAKKIASQILGKDSNTKMGSSDSSGS